jgi:hypothetical protein
VYTDLIYEQGISDHNREIQSWVELVFLARYIYAFIVEGFGTFDRLLTYLETKQVPGIAVGTRDFSRDSDFTEEWKELALATRSLTQDSESGRFVTSSRTTREIIQDIIGYVTSAQGNQ